MTASPADVKQQVVHLLRHRDVINEHGRLVGLDIHEAQRVVHLLADAGLLRDEPASLATPISPEQAEVSYLRGLNDLRAGVHHFTFATAGTASLRWLTVDREFHVDDHQGKHHRGTDLAAAITAYNQLITGQSSR